MVKEVHSSIINSKNTVRFNEWGLEIWKPYLIFANNVAVASSLKFKIELRKIDWGFEFYFDQLERKWIIRMVSFDLFFLK